MSAELPLNNINLNQAKGIQADSNLGAQEQLESLLESLDIRGDKRTQKLHESVKDAIALLNDQNSSLSAYKKMADLFDAIVEIDPDQLENACEDLKELRKKNKKASMSDVLALKTEAVLTLLHSQTSSDSQVLPISTLILDKMKLFSPGRNPELFTSLELDYYLSEQEKINITKLAALGYSFEKAEKALARFPVLLNALFYLVSTEEPPSILSQILEKQQQENSAFFVFSHSVTNIEERHIKTFTKALQQLSGSASISSATPITDKEADAFFNATINKSADDLTLGDLTGMYIYMNHFKPAQDTLVVAKKASVNSLSANGQVSSFKALGEFGPDDIKNMIDSMITNGLKTVDDLCTLLQLLGELGFNAPKQLMDNVVQEIQSFVDTFAASASDPSELLVLLEVINTFAKSDIVSELNLDLIGTELTELLDAEVDENTQDSIAVSANALNLNIDVSPTKDSETSPSTSESPVSGSRLAEQQAASSNQSTQKQRQDTQRIDASISAKETKTPSSKRISTIQAKPTASSLQTRNHSEQHKKDILESSQQILQELEKLLLEKLKPSFEKSTTDLMSNTLKANLEKLLSSFNGG